ncbi:MAG: Holliday junction resolvase RuvX [Lachnospiraceae bacterium]|nr:Holliday junction resolvase RuvX [Lachnospiraceae bacterium]
MRILGLDYGQKTVGVAISDELGITSQGVETITRNKENQLRKTLARIEELCEMYGVSSIVLGYPKNMDNSIGEQAEKSEEFAELLKRRTGIDVILWDERLTSKQARDVLEEGNVRDRREQKKVIDKLAAALILQSYLDTIRHG